MERVRRLRIIIERLPGRFLFAMTILFSVSLALNSSGAVMLAAGIRSVAALPTRLESQPAARPEIASLLQPHLEPELPIRAAFYYPWFPQGWTQQGIFPYTNYHPSL